VVGLGAAREAAIVVIATVEPRQVEVSLERSKMVTEEIHPHHHR
jgi:hypothetical protein